MLFNFSETKYSDFVNHRKLLNLHPRISCPFIGEESAISQIKPQKLCLGRDDQEKADSFRDLTF
jgi:hypothetical protein